VCNRITFIEPGNTV